MTIDEEHLENFKIDVIECGSKIKAVHKKRENEFFFCMFCMLLVNEQKKYFSCISNLPHSIAERKARKMIAMIEIIDA